jgi:hypothetical protein
VVRRAALVSLLAAACRPAPRETTPREMPSATIQIGECGVPGRDGVRGTAPITERADRDLDGDGTAELIVTDRALCTPEGNCYWNVFLPGRAGDCTRYVGTFAAAALEPLASRGDDNMSDVRGYWNLHGGRLLLQSYRFARGGYQLVEALLCRRSTGDDTLDCMDADE